VKGVKFAPAAAAGSQPVKGWIAKELYSDISHRMPYSQLAKFERALLRGIVGPRGESGIKVLAGEVNGFTHELKIGGSAARLLGKQGTWNGNPVIIFTEYLPSGLH
jgi:hypothetical protein